MANAGYIGGNCANASFTQFSNKFSLAAPSSRSGSSATEAFCALKLDKAGTLSLLQIQCTTNAQSGSTTITSRRNSAAGNQTISVAAAATGIFQDTTHSDSVSAGNTIDYNISAPNNATFAVATLGSLFSGTSVTAGFTAASDQNSSSGSTVNAGNASVTRYIPGIGAGDNSQPFYTIAEATAQAVAVSAGTLSRLGTYVSSNTSTNSITWVFRKNTANGNQTISIAAGAGYTEDTTHTDTITGGDLIDTASTSGAGTVNASSCFTVYTFTSSSAALDLRQGNTRIAGQGWSSSVPTFAPIAGDNVVNFSTEGPAQTQFPFGATFSNLIATVSNASGTGAQPMTFRINGANGNQTISIDPAVLGTVQDVTHTDATALNDLVNVRLPAIGSSSTVCFKMFGLSVGGTVNVTVNIVGVQATAAAGTVLPNPNIPAIGVQGSGTPGLLSSFDNSVAAPHVAASTHVGNLILGQTASITGVQAAGAAHAVTPNPGGQAAHASATGVASGVHGTGQFGIFGVQATAVARGLVPAIGVPVRGVHGAGSALPVGIYATPISYLLANRIMRNTPVPAVGAMSNEAVAVVARLYPSGPQPRSVEVFLAGVRAQGVAHHIQTSLIVSVHLTGVQAIGQVRPVVGVGNVV